MYVYEVKVWSHWQKWMSIVHHCKQHAHATLFYPHQTTDRHWERKSPYVTFQRLVAPTCVTSPAMGCIGLLLCEDRLSISNDFFCSRIVPLSKTWIVCVVALVQCQVILHFALKRSCRNSALMLANNKPTYCFFKRGNFVSKFGKSRRIVVAHVCWSLTICISHASFPMGARSKASFGVFAVETCSCIWSKLFHFFFCICDRFVCWIFRWYNNDACRLETRVLCESYNSGIKRTYRARRPCCERMFAFPVHIVFVWRHAAATVSWRHSSFPCQILFIFTWRTSLVPNQHQKMTTDIDLESQEVPLRREEEYIPQKSQTCKLLDNARSWQ